MSAVRNTSDNARPWFKVAGAGRGHAAGRVGAERRIRQGGFWSCGSFWVKLLVGFRVGSGLQLGLGLRYRKAKDSECAGCLIL